MKLVILPLYLLALLLGPVALCSQEMPVPIEVQYPLFLKIITFDKNLSERCKDEIIIGIVYQQNFKQSLDVMKELVEVIEKGPVQKIMDKPIRYVLINLDVHNLEKRVQEQDVHLLYIAPLRAESIEKISQIADKYDLLTLSGVPEYIPKGLAVGLQIEGKKPKVLINNKVALQENVVFNSQILKLAKVIE